jgi:hypothetical protein
MQQLLIYSFSYLTPVTSETSNYTHNAPLKGL